MGIGKIWTNLALKWKLVLLCFLVIILMTIGSFSATSYTSKMIDVQIDSELTKLAEGELKRISEGVYNMVKTQDELLKVKLQSDLSVARKEIADAGGVRFDGELVDWSAVNQFSKQISTVKLPKMMVGQTWLGQVRSSKVRTFIVDSVREMVGGTCTVFQRMNSQGDMLRVATNVLTKDGERAIGTYIPATNPDGTSNPVIQAVLRGETFVGKAFVVNAWYITAYEPIRSETGEIKGVLYVGIPMEMVKTLRESIESIKVGKSGYVYIVGAKGDQKGITAVHPSGVGKDISGAKSSDGRFIIPEQIKKVVELKPGESYIDYYPWINPGETKAREKFSALIYYEPWDWVIGASTYFDDFMEVIARIDNEWKTARNLQMLVTLITVLLASFISWLVAIGISSPLNAGEMILRNLAQSGDISKLPDDHSLERKDEIGYLSRSIDILVKQQKFLAGMCEELANGNWNQDIRVKSDKDLLGISLDQMVSQINLALSGVKIAAEEVDSGSGQISDASQSLSQGATESASSIEEISSSITEIGGQTKANAENATQANVLATQTRSAAETGNKRMGEMMGAMGEIQQSSNQIAKIIKVIDDIAFQTNLLSLNAAVEAARAGKHGKGFAVVADEVRNLASRSAKAAKETSEMIESSIGKVKAGNEIAKLTEEALQEIVASSVKVADLVGEIAAASSEQAQGITQIGQGLEQIDKVTQQNTANAEETAAAAEELSGQARELNSLLSRFQLKNDEEVEFAPQPVKSKSAAPAKAGKTAGGNKAPEPKSARKASPVADGGKASEPKPARKMNPSDVIALDDDEFGRY